MSRHSIMFMLIALITLQSVMAVADDYRTVQFDIENHTIEQLLERGENVSFSDPHEITEELAELITCDCCHCPGTCLLLLGHDYAISLPFSTGGENIDFQNSYASIRATPDNPPPIC